jgi:hypothetical protein
VDLLLCAHHYRVSEHALADAGATVFDTHGAPLKPDLFALATGRLPRREIGQFRVFSQSIKK